MRTVIGLIIILISINTGDYIEKELLMPQDRLLINGKWHCSNVEGLECKYILIEGKK